MTDHGKGEDFLSVFWAVTGDLHGHSVQLYKPLSSDMLLTDPAFRLPDQW